MLICPYCGMNVPDFGTECPFCHRDISGAKFLQFSSQLGCKGTLIVLAVLIGAIVILFPIVWWLLTAIGLFR